MDRSAGRLVASDLILSGTGIGQASVASAVWLDDFTARFAIVGTWSTGEIQVELAAGHLRDRAGNAVLGSTSRFTLTETKFVSLEASAIQVNAGALITATLRYGPGLSTDRIGLFSVGGNDDQAIDWFYLNGTKSSLTSGRTSAQLQFTAPSSSGEYQFRFFSSGVRIAASESFVVTGVDIFLDFDGGFLPNLPGVVVVEGATGRLYDPFHAYGSQTWDEQVRQILERVQADFAAIRGIGRSGRQLAEQPAIRTR